MKVLYEGVEINLEISKCKIIDNMGGKADSLAISFADIKHECRTWNFEKDNIIEIRDGPFSTGIMYVDGYSCGNGIYNIDALSLRKLSKTKKTRIWEKVSFIDIVKDIAKDEEMFLEVYGEYDFKYERVEQIQKNNIEFLNYRCMLEGLNLKINNGKMIIVSEQYLEAQKEIFPVDSNQFIGKYEFKCISNHVYGGCEVSSYSKRFINGKYILNSKNTEIKRITDIAVYSFEEANRFSRNILRAFNKYETIGVFTIANNIDIAAGNTIKIGNLDSFNGKYIVESVIYDLIGGKSKLTVRKVLEGY